MANECRHRMTIKGDPARVEPLFTEIRGLPGTANELMDLNSIIPAPDTITKLMALEHIGVVRQAVRSEATFAEYRQRQDKLKAEAWLETGCENWSDWAQSMWGSMSNVFHVEYAEDEPNTILFSTLWTPAIPALIELSAISPMVTLKIAFADESGYIIGEGTVKAGRRRIRKHPIGTPEGRQIFESFWGRWFGPDESADQGEQGVIDLTHKRAD
jgi:hypothetical protein